MILCSVQSCGKEHYAKGLCRNHWHQYKNGTIDQNGIMILKTKQCESCNKTLVFDASSSELRHLKWCKNCRPAEYNKTALKGYYRRKQNPKKYITKCLNKIIKELNLRKRHSPIIEMRKQKKTFNEIGKFFGISRQRVHQICSKYLAEGDKNVER